MKKIVPFAHDDGDKGSISVGVVRSREGVVSGRSFTSVQSSVGGGERVGWCCIVMTLYIQWDLSYRDTNGAEEESVIVSEVSSFQRLKCMQEWHSGCKKVSS